MTSYPRYPVVSKYEFSLFIALLITTAAAWLVAILTHFDKAAIGIMAFIVLMILMLWYHEAFK